MGRTNPTYRDLVRATEERWSDYRRALRCGDQPHFDRLFEHARGHADAAGYLNHQSVEIPILVSIVLEQQKELAELRDRLDRREEERPQSDDDGGDAGDGGDGDGGADTVRG